MKSILKVRSIKKNFMFNFVRLFLNIIFPIVTFPYVSRILLAEGVGRVTFAQSVINYFILFSALGIPMYGIRSVAQVRDDKKKLSQLVYELSVILLVFTTLIYVVFIVFVNINVKLSGEKELLYLMSISILFTNMGVDWFYQGVEDYKYITVRSLIFKIISLILLFILVNTKDDYNKYALVIVISQSGSGILNFIHLKNYISLDHISRRFDIRKHMKPIIYTFSFSLATSIYLNLDTVMLGYIANERSVGLYTASIKITKLTVVLVTSLGAVLVPRISYYVKNDMFEELKKAVQMSMKFTFMLGVPAVAGLFILAPNVILVFAGSDFRDAVLSMRIMLPIIIFLGLSNLIGIQLLYSYGKEKKVLISVIVGAIVNFSLNMILIPKYSHYGAAVATLVAEGLVLIVQILVAKDLLSLLGLDKTIFKYIISAFIMAFALNIIPDFSSHNAVNLGVSILVGSFIYFSILLILKEDMITKIMKEGVSYVKKV